VGAHRYSHPIVAVLSIDCNSLALCACRQSLVTTVPLDAEATLTLAFTLIPANQFDQAGAMIVVDEVRQSHRLFCSLRAPTRQQWELALPSESGAI
jgi:hypothetical protein